MSKVIHLLGTPAGSWGGMERHTIDLARAQSELGEEVYILADASYEIYVPKGVGFHALDVSRSRRSLLLWWRLRQLLNLLRPDVVHAQGAKAAALLSAQSAWLKRAGVISVGTVHGTKSSHKAYAQLSGVIAVSETIAAQLSHPHIRVIPNGVSPKNPDPGVLAECCAARARWSGSLVLAIGRLVPVKGYDVLLNAWPVAVDAHLLIIGEGPERAALERIVVQRGLQHRVSFAGYSTAVNEWLQVADAVVISSHREGFPYVLIEALQAGCPVLSTKVSGVSDILPTEAMVAPGDVSGLNALLVRVLPDLSDMHRTQQPQFLKARTLFTLSSMANLTLDFYAVLRRLAHV